MQLANPNACLRPIKTSIIIDGETGMELSTLQHESPLDPVEILLLAHLGVSPTIIDLLLSELERSDSQGDAHV
jgi:hypothetical protein